MLVGPAPSTSNQRTENSEAGLQSIRSLIGEGKYAEAEAEAEGLVSVIQSAQGSGSLEVARATDLLVEALICNGKGAEPRTRALAEQAIRSKEAHVGADDSMLAPSLRNLGDVLAELFEYQLAIAPYERAVAVRERALGREDPVVGDDLDHLAWALTLAEHHDQALTAITRALGIKEKTLDRGDAKIARTLEVHGSVLQRRGEYARARPVLQRALALREAVDPAHPQMARTLSLIGTQFWFEGDLVQAKQFSARAVAVAENALRPGHPDLAYYLRNLALPVADLGDLADARTLRERALAIAESSLGSDHPLVAVQLNDLANSLVLQGEYSEARQTYERALQIYERRLGPQHTRVTTVVYNLAIVSAALGDYSEARRQFNRAIATWERVVGPNHPFVARAADALAEMLSEQGFNAEAKALYERALAIRERTLGKNHRDVARTLAKLSATVARQGQVGQAYELSTRALTIWEQSAERETRSAAEAFILHAGLQAIQGDDRAARTSYERALDILRRILGPSHPSVAEAEASLAVAVANLGQTAEALRTALNAEQSGRDHLRLTLRYLPERQALAYGARRPKGLDLALSLWSSDPAATTLTFDALIRGRALILDEMAARRHEATEASSPDVAPLWKALTSARQRLANLVVRGPGEQRSDQYVALVQDAQREKELAERALAEKSARFKSRLSRAESGLDEVRAALPPGTALVSFVRFERTVFNEKPADRKMSASPARPVPSYVAFILHSGESTPTVVPLGSAAAIESLVARWRRNTVTLVAERSLRTSGTMLRQRVWDPLAAHLQEVTRIFVVPDGSLNLVPLAALPTGQTSYLLEQAAVIHYLSAERDLVRPADAATGRGLLALGGPAFGNAEDFAALAPERQSPSVRTPAPFRGARSACGSFQTLRFGALPAARREADEIAALWKEFGSNTSADIDSLRVLTGGHANERAFKELGPGTRVLHLATHGFFLGNACVSALDGTRAVGGLAVATKTEAQPASDENPLLLSGLALAGANRRAAAGPEEEDGILTAEEVASLNLTGVQWAVLSACDTGLGEVKVGEGVFGLRRAFQVAGARTVVMSLWSVQDQAASQWMRALYQGRLQKQLDTADAMRYASMTVLRLRREKRQSTHPFYWAGFVAAGDWR